MQANSTGESFTAVNKSLPDYDHKYDEIEYNRSPLMDI